MPPLSSVHPGAWTAFFCAVAINLTMGVNYSWSVFQKALITDAHWTSVEASLPFTVYSLVYALTMIFAGRLQDKLGPRPVATLGACVLGAGMISCGYAGDPLSLAISYGVFVSIGYSTCYATTIPPVAKWFPPEHKGLVTGAVVGALGMAAVYFAPLANWMVTGYGVGKTFQYLGTGIALVILLAAQFLNNPPAGYSSGALSGQPAATHGRDYSWREMLRSRSFYKLWLIIFLSSSSGLMILGHMATIAKVQAGWENGYYLVILLAVFNSLGRIAGGILSDKFGRIEVMKAVFFLQAINSAFFAYYATPELLAVGAVVTGFSYGACIALFPLVTSDFYGMKNFGVNYGLIFTSWGVAGIFGPLLAGWVVDTTGAYSLAYMASGALLAVAVAVAMSTSSCRR